MTKRMVISADSHVVEPDDLFTKALGATYGDKLPQIVPSHAGTDGPFLYTGLEYVHLSGTMDVGDDTADKLEEANQGPLDPALLPRPGRNLCRGAGRHDHDAGAARP